MTNNEMDDYKNLNGFILYLVLFADDKVLSGKISKPHKLYVYCFKWKIEVNKNKTEIVVFRKRWQNITFTWYSDSTQLNVFKSYVYLGVLLHL